MATLVSPSGALAVEIPSVETGKAVDNASLPTPKLHLNGKPASIRSSTMSGNTSLQPGDDGWGSNFWVTLVDPQTQVSFYACPSSGEVSWDPPVGNFLLPPNPEGEWWEMNDEASGLPYYHHTKTGETTWERPQAFVIPLGILQNTALGRRLSVHRTSLIDPSTSLNDSSVSSDRIPYRRSRSYAGDIDTSGQSQSPNTSNSYTRRRSQSSTRSSPGKVSPANSSPNSTASKKQAAARLSSPAGHALNSSSHSGPLAYPRGHSLAPIPGSPYTTDAEPGTPTSGRKSLSATPVNGRQSTSRQASSKEKDAVPRRSSTMDDAPALARSHSKASTFISYRAPQPQSLTAALEMIALSNATEQGRVEQPRVRISTEPGPSELSYAESTPPPSPSRLAAGRTDLGKSSVPSTPHRPSLALPQTRRSVSTPSTPVVLRGKQISSPVHNPEAAVTLNALSKSGTGQPILIDFFPKADHRASFNTGRYPVLPHDLASDIQQFSESQFARQYFSTHRTGFIFRRRIPVEQMMIWQKPPLNSPLLNINRNLHKDALKVFKVIQRIMGDRERDRPVGVRMPPDAHTSTVAPINGSTTSLTVGQLNALVEEERWLLGEGLTHGELRDEIYCQIMKQVTNNPSPESTFKGWQLMCVLLVTFPPSKNFETSLRAYMQQATSQHEGRVDVMAKYCLRRLAYISKKGPRGKPPTAAEIETASDAAFHPSTFGESLDAIFRLQERTYPHMQVPIILPFLADGILALGGTKSEGIFRVPGDGDAVSELKLRIDKGYYSLDGVEDPHVLASLLKLWLRELCDPLVPDELYNDCIAHARDADACVQIVQRLPTINRRVVLFVVSFLQLFLEERVQGVTKMTAPNLALVMAPNLLRCNSESMAVVFTNAQYEQTFVHNLLLHLKCDEVDPEYVPTHGQGAVPAPAPLSRTSKSHRRRTNH